MYLGTGGRSTLIFIGPQKMPLLCSQVGISISKVHGLPRWQEQGYKRDWMLEWQPQGSFHHSNVITCLPCPASSKLFMFKMNFNLVWVYKYKICLYIKFWSTWKWFDFRGWIWFSYHYLLPGDPHASRAYLSLLDFSIIVLWLPASLRGPGNRV